MRRLLWWSVWVVLVGQIPLRLGWAEETRPRDESPDDEVVVKSIEGHHLLLPKDWPVEKRDGRLVPIPIEEYLSRKFRAIEQTLQQFGARLGALEKRLGEFEQRDKALQIRLRLLEEASHHD